MPRPIETTTPSMWTSPKGRRAAQKQLTFGLGALDRYGEAIWEEITFLSANHEPFRLSEVAQWLADEYRLSFKTADNYVRAFFAYCRAAPEEFGGPSSKLTHCAGHKWQLLDNPE